MTNVTRRLVTVAACIAVVAGACGGGGSKKTTASPSTVGAPSSTEAATTSTTTAGAGASAAGAGPIPLAAPQGFERVERLCYSVLLPKGNDANTGENSCSMRAHWDPVGGVYFQPDPFAKSLTEMIDRFKSDPNRHPLKVDRDLTVGGFPAHLFVEDNRGATGPDETATTVVYLDAKSYDVQGAPVKAFNITGDYSTAAEFPDYGARDKVYDTIIASVQFK